MTKVLILGAGISGLCAARELKANGHEVTLVDKGRGVGGRMATRRFEGGTFDHGAQFFTVRSPEFRELLEGWQQQDVAKEWFRGYPSPNDQKPDDDYPRYCGEGGMTAIPKFLMQGLDVQLGEQISNLNFENGLWTAITDEGHRFEGEELIITAPVPQSLALLKNIDLPSPALATLDSLSYEPCFSVMVNLNGPSGISEPGPLYVDGEVIAWIADNSQKGVSAREGSVTIHSAGVWAKAHFEDDKEAVGAKLIDAAREYLQVEVESFQVHRWRYSKPENPLEIGSLRVPELNLTFAGDIFQGAKIEGAVLSGLNAARSIG